MKNTISIGFFLLILVNSIFLFLKISNENLESASYASNIIMMVIQLLAFYIILMQLKQQKHLSVAQFISQIMDQLADQKEFHQKIQSSDDPDITNSEVVAFLNVFENIAALIDTGVIGIKHIDNPFAFRFFLTVHNKKVQDLELYKDSAYYKAIYKLHRIWMEYRTSLNLKTINNQNTLESNPLYNELAV